MRFLTVCVCARLAYYDDANGEDKQTEDKNKVPQDGNDNEEDDAIQEDNVKVTTTTTTTKKPTPKPASGTTVETDDVEYYDDEEEEGNQTPKVPSVTDEPSEIIRYKYIPSIMS